MKIVFSFATTYRMCNETRGCKGIERRHKLGQYEEDGKIYQAFMCTKCFTINTEDVRGNRGLGHQAHDVAVL